MKASDKCWDKCCLWIQAHELCRIDSQFIFFVNKRCKQKAHVHFHSLRAAYFPFNNLDAMSSSSTSLSVKLFAGFSV